jgi:hypothetical protein
MLMGFVHGDLRLPNLIVCGDKLYLVDFDCGRKEIIATLPDVRPRPILREGRGDVRITEANDVGVLDDAEELLRGDIEKKRGKRRPAQNTHVPSQFEFNSPLFSSFQSFLVHVLISRYSLLGAGCCSTSSNR